MPREERATRDRWLLMLIQIGTAPFANLKMSVGAGVEVENRPDFYICNGVLTASSRFAASLWNEGCGSGASILRLCL